MGLTLPFYTGNGRGIIQAFDQIEINPDAVFVYLENYEEGVNRAEFALHITPHDLSILTAELRRVLGAPNISLRENLDFDGDFVDQPDRGAYLVAGEWLKLWADFDPCKSEDLTGNWFGAMQREYEDLEIAMTQDASRAVSDLITVCANADRDSLDLVHTWFG